MNARWATPPKQTGCGNGGDDCDLKEFDDLNCSVVGVAAQAEYMKKYQPKLTERRGRFDTARTSYQQMRANVEPTVTAIKAAIGDPEKTLCQVPAGDRECLREAWYVVKEKLEECGTAGGCCVKEADTQFDAELDDTPTGAEVQAAIAKFEAQVGRVESCFETLLAEPANLRKRVDDLDAFVKTALKNTNLKQAFAQLLWAKYRADTVYWGFANAAAFEDCLCRALNASLTGRQALALLSGINAELVCQEEGTKDRCTSLQGNVVAEIMSICQRQHPPASTATAR